MSVGLVSYGVYLPRCRLKLSDINLAWEKNLPRLSKTISEFEKTVPASDEDAVTIAVEASLNALRPVSLKPSAIEGLLMGSESHPYAVNPSSTIVGNLLGVGNNYLAADLEFACKAGSAGIELIAGLVDSGHIKLGLAIGADTAQSKPKDALECTSAAAGAAFVIGNKNLAVKLLHYSSFSSDTPDFWRRDGSPFPSHAGRFTGEPAYYAHILGAARQLFNQTGIKPAGVDYCVFHMPNSKFPRDISDKLGFSKTQLAPSLVVDKIGNPYSASSLVGLAAVLDQARPGQRIFMVSYGSGAGSDAFIWQVEKRIVAIQKSQKAARTQVQQQISSGVSIDYLSYLQQTHKI